MGNGIAKLSPCFSTSRRRRDAAAVSSDPCEEGLGHSFCYVRPELLAAKTEETTTFRSISGAAIGANASTPPSTSDLYALTSHLTWPAAAFDCSTSFSSVPLQPLPRFSSGPLSGPISDRGFLSGPIERAYLSGPIDPRALPFSGPLDAKRTPSSNLLRRSLSRGATSNLLRGISRAIARTISVKRAVKSESLDSSAGSAGSSNQAGSSERTSDDSDSLEPVSSGSNLQWAQGKAGEDRVHVVVSEEHGWVFVGIYDGFNGPDATDYLLANLYSALHRELKGLLWDDDKHESRELYDEKVGPDECYREGKQRRRFRGAGRKWNCDCERESSDLDPRLKKQQNKSNQREAANHLAVLKALSQALRKTEEAYLDIADKNVMENPELALMGSCVLVMLMKGEDVYLMNVGDSRAVLALKAEHDSWSSGGKERQDLEMISEEMNVVGDGIMDGLPSLAALQLTLDHSTSVDEEVHRIRNEHPNDACAIVNDRVKGSLKVTRAFGAGFLKRPKWNDALLEMFRIDYIGSTPYISCTPSLRHHKLGSRDRFLILSSDGLYQYFTNEEAVSQVELFIAMCPEGDPAQHLVEEVLFRAAEKAGMDFHELLEIPHGDRRRYHDDVSIIVVSLEGRIWRSCV